MGFYNCVMAWIHNYGIIQSDFLALKSPLCSAYSSFYYLLSLETTNFSFYNLRSHRFTFSRFHIVGIIEYVAFSEFHLVICTCVLHVFSCFHSSFLNNTPLFGYTGIYFYPERHLDFFQSFGNCD